ncbi:MAG: thioesterase domain-containing protein, partial [Planctomycetota bacterium]|nr:thioesterase domain-containing protein [Planctomycetota bacterium]
GLQGAGLWCERWPRTRVRAMAGHYLEAVREARPHGPYLLGGYCMGGLVALEMARRLQAQGETVALLAVLDTPWPRMADRWRSFPHRVIDSVTRCRWSLRWAPEILARRRQAPRLDARFRRHVEELHRLAFNRCRPRPYAGRAVAVIARDHADYDRRRSEAFLHRAVPNARIVNVPGTHLSCVTDALATKEIAAALEKSIAAKPH